MKIARGYDPKTQGRIGLFAAQLDDQLARLKKEVVSLTVEQLEWQQKPDEYRGHVAGAFVAGGSLVDQNRPE
jgi:hypothetical protein